MALGSWETPAGPAPVDGGAHAQESLGFGGGFGTADIDGDGALDLMISSWAHVGGDGSTGRIGVFRGVDLGL